MKRILKLPIKRKWLAALRSGKYKQGREALRRDDDWNPNITTFCCLGVLADLVDPKGWKRIKPDNLISSSWQHRGEDGLLTLRVSVAACCKSQANQFHHDAMPSLAEMNDEGASFKHIANWIKKNL